MRNLIMMFLVAIITICFAISAHAAIDPKDILGMWTFDEAEGKSVRDLSGNEHDGEIVGKIKWVDGKYGKAIEFAGGYIRVEHTDDMNLETFSLLAWVSVPKVVDPYQFVVGKEAWPDRNYSMWIRPDTIVVGITNGGDNQVPGASVVGGEWHHVAGIYNKEFLRIYVDGVQSSQISLSTTPKTCNAPLMIGAQPPGGSAGQIQGAIDEVGVFRIGLEDEDIERIMEGGLKSLAHAVEPGGKLSTTWGAMKLNLYDEAGKS